MTPLELYNQFKQGYRWNTNYKITIEYIPNLSYPNVPPGFIINTFVNHDGSKVYTYVGYGARFYSLDQTWDAYLNTYSGYRQEEAAAAAHARSLALAELQQKMYEAALQEQARLARERIASENAGWNTDEEAIEAADIASDAAYASREAARTAAEMIAEAERNAKAVQEGLENIEETIETGATEIKSSYLLIAGIVILAAYFLLKEKK